MNKIQLSILNEAARLVKEDGLLVYSTCTVDQDENIGTIQQFLVNHPDFEPHALQLPEGLAR